MFQICLKKKQKTKKTKKNKQTNKKPPKNYNTEWENKFPSALNEHVPLKSKVTRRR